MKKVIILISILVLLTGCVTYNITQEFPEEVPGDVIDEENVVDQIEEVDDIKEEVVQEGEVEEILPDNQYRLIEGETLLIAGTVLKVDTIQSDATVYFIVNDEKFKVSSTNYPELVGPFTVTLKSFDFAQSEKVGENTVVVEVIPTALEDNQYLLFKGDFVVFENNNKVQLDDVKNRNNIEYIYISIIGTNIQEHEIALGEVETFDQLNFTGSGVDKLVVEPVFAASKTRYYAVLDMKLNPEEE